MTGWKPNLEAQMTRRMQAFIYPHPEAMMDIPGRVFIELSTMNGMVLSCVVGF